MSHCARAEGSEACTRSHFQRIHYRPGSGLNTATERTEAFERYVTAGQYEARLIVFVQGKKRINVGKAIYVCGESNFLLTSINLPVVSKVIAASVKEPILGLMLLLDMRLVREILSQQEFALHEKSTDACGMAVGISSLELLDACTRLVDLLDAPQDIPFLGSLIQRRLRSRPRKREPVQSGIQQILRPAAY